ncbi:hypothetical protein M2459_000363 [Parabacteroides sp. PF5-5]|nr:hypothetical protein [Parabacteroides sp. PH5-39]MDH6314648.1 hypothetical protein [Parabacteroides sp. PF5-13]MDH6321087.1 hypothetical protein [Parabacteroides sp. PH5-13]MDH6324819.1 hypothetical protein [Parabacteroides sp. PH5-8]MDH6325500.1 hypothetical protein [Parabacteroides sp. PH5-41]MDH6333637.1 hypothetical protein [Parabacteroides sp. PF5-5]MDH6344364.1 hypothetical protein [Parabacteroides sp. PH5-46]MDH6359658.1 hypothetical protein [Parabacteroides sp. PH5-16]MDH6375325.
MQTLFIIIDTMKKVIAHQGLFKALTNAEHFDTHDAIINYGMDKHMLIPGLTAVWNTYTANFLVESKKFCQTKSRLPTKELAQLNVLRNDSLRSINRTVEYYTFSKNKAKKAAAIQLKDCLLLYKGTGSKSYTKNSTLITDLVINLKEEPNRTAAGLLELEEEIDLLETHNNAFKALYRTRAQKKMEGQRLKLYDVRRTVDFSFSAVADALLVIRQSMLLITPGSEHIPLITSLIDTFNSYIITASENLSRRTSRYTLSLDDAQDVALPYEGSDADRGIVTEGFAEVSDLNVQGQGVGVGLVSPDAAEQEIAADGDIQIGSQYAEDFGLARGDQCFTVAGAQLVGTVVEDGIADTEDFFLYTSRSIHIKTLFDTG